jgi:glutamate-1-semialdehyde 2,1-aminomutase
MFFTPQVVRDWNTVKQSNTHYYAAYFRKMLEHGVYMPPSQFEAAFVSLAHREDIITHTIEAASEALNCLEKD